MLFTFVTKMLFTFVTKMLFTLVTKMLFTLVTKMLFTVVIKMAYLFQTSYKYPVCSIKKKREFDKPFQTCQAKIINIVNYNKLQLWILQV